jgi:protein involved in polysaccharide export with SLBB domain
VNRPGSYLINPLTGVFNSLYLCGGPTKKGTLRKIKILRQGTEIASVDMYDFLLSGKKKGDIFLKDGDTIFVPLIGKVVGIAGIVNRPAIYEVNEGASLKDLFYLAGGLMPTSYLNRVQIQRVVANEYKTVIDISVAKNKLKKEYITLKDLDTVRVFPIYAGISNVVSLQGEVKQPGTYELKPGMRVKDVIPSMGSLLFTSNLDRAELVRINPQDRSRKVLAVDLRKLYSGDETQNIELRPLDRLVVYADIKMDNKINISGEVKVPGIYTIEEGETLSSVLERAGGFTDKAYLFGAMFIRRSAQENQQSSVGRLINDMERRVIIESSLKVNSPEEATLIQARYGRMEELLLKLRASQAKGRIIVHMNIPERLKDTKDDVVLEDGDSIYIPRTPSIVSVLGEVYDSNSLLFEDGKNGSYYIDRVGGLNKAADRDSLYIIRADGTILSSERCNVFDAQMYRGDTIIVPQRIEIPYDWGKWLANTLDILFKTASVYAIVRTASQ